jgi:hypothetical protein
VRATDGNCCLPVSLGPLACAIAEQFTTEELGVLSMYITALGDQLALIAAQRVACAAKCQKKSE